jgi:hypothetical protein
MVRVEEQSPDVSGPDDFQSVIAETLGAEDLGIVRVRFVPWSEESDDRRYVCQVYAKAIDDAERGPRWVWWSSLFETAEELRTELRKALSLSRAEAELAAEAP